MPDLARIIVMLPFLLMAALIVTAGYYQWKTWRVSSLHKFQQGIAERLGFGPLFKRFPHETLYKLSWIAAAIVAAFLFGLTAIAFIGALIK